MIFPLRNLLALSILDILLFTCAVPLVDLTASSAHRLTNEAGAGMTNRTLAAARDAEANRNAPPGIKCGGSDLCYLDLGPIRYINELAWGTAPQVPGFGYNYGPIGDNDSYAPAKHLICKDRAEPPILYWYGGYCAFTENGGGPLTGALIKQKMMALHNACSFCGYITLSDDGDLSKGILKVDAVSELVCKGAESSPETTSPPTHLTHLA
ncbi:MAG: hypothetical protein Q9167_003871 [Letrouitia subvulpina]